MFILCNKFFWQKYSVCSTEISLKWQKKSGKTRYYVDSRVPHLVWKGSVVGAFLQSCASFPLFTLRFDWMRFWRCDVVLTLQWHEIYFHCLFFNQTLKDRRSRNAHCSSNESIYLGSRAFLPLGASFPLFMLKCLRIRLNTFLKMWCCPYFTVT